MLRSQTILSYEKTCKCGQKGNTYLGKGQGSLRVASQISEFLFPSAMGKIGPGLGKKHLPLPFK